MTAPTHYQRAEDALATADALDREQRPNDAIIAAGILGNVHATLSLVGAVDRLTRFIREQVEKDSDSTRFAHARIREALELAAAGDGPNVDQLADILCYGDAQVDLGPAARRRRKATDLIDRARAAARGDDGDGLDADLLDHLADALEDRL